MDLRTARRVLVCLRYGIGDLVMETPALEMLRRTASQAHISALGARPAIELLEGDPRVDELFCVQDWGLTHWGERGDEALRARLWAWLDEREFDVIIDPSHAVFAVGETIWARGGALLLDTDSHAQMRALQEGHDGATAIRLAVARSWGIEVPVALRPLLHLHEEELVHASEFMAEHGLTPAPLGLSPVASSALKRWPVERLAEVADRLIERTGSPALVLSGPQVEAGTALREGMRHADACVSVGTLHLRRVAALLAHCRILVGNDTGLMHLAAAVHTPTVAVFGPTYAGIYRPEGAHAAQSQVPCPVRRTTVFGPPDCVAIGHCLAGLRSCIDSVQIEEVVRRAEAALAAPAVAEGLR
jgi:ADP-heptose:LPS heptosyltransferase